MNRRGMVLASLLFMLIPIGLIGAAAWDRPTTVRYLKKAHERATHFVEGFFAQPTSGWRRLPLHGPCVHAHNRWAWHLNRTYGQASVIEALQRSCERVQKDHPEFRLAVQDISWPKGGPMLGHLSHRWGRDVDIVFIGRDRKGRISPSRPELGSPLGMYRRNFNQEGRWGQVRFDEELNWAFLMALRSNPSRPVEKVLVEPHIEARLLATGRRLGASKSALQWASNKLRFAGHNAADHEDHMHVRFRR